MPPDRLTRAGRIRWLQSEIAFERHRSVHTGVSTPARTCLKHPARAGKCVWCLEEDLTALLEQHAPTYRSTGEEGSSDGAV